MKQLLAVLIVFGCSLSASADEPEYKGKSLSYWMQKLKAKDKLVRQNAVHALGKIRSRSRSITSALRKALQDPEPNVRAEAADSLGRRRGAARECVPDLIKVFEKDKNTLVRGAAALALGFIGGNKDAATALAKGLKEKNLHIRTHASYALGRMGRSARPAVPALVAALKDDSVTVRRNARNALKRIDPDALREAERKNKKNSKKK